MSTDGKSLVHRLRAYWILLLGLLLIALWALFSMNSWHGGGEGDSVGIAGSSGGGGTGNGSGSGGSGSGDSGNGTGAGRPVNPASPAAQGPAPETPDPVPPGDTKEVPVTDGTGDTAGAVLESIPKTALVQSLAEVIPVTQPEIKNTGGTLSGKRGFYGIDVKKDGKVLFLIDVSGSMDAPSAEFQGKSRLGVLKDELTKSICGGRPKPTAETYQRNGGFIITRFSSDAKSYPDDGICRYHKKKDVDEALKHVESLSSEGGTNMIPGWQEALERAEQNEVDTIYFLTDGEPGDGFQPEHLEEMLKRKSSLKRIRINCIAIGGDRQFMKDIANAHRGKYVFLP